MKHIFPERLGQKHGCALHMGAHYTQQNMVTLKGAIKLVRQAGHSGCPFPFVVGTEGDLL